MAVRTIVGFRDPRLRMPAVPVAHFDEALHILSADLLDTMRAAPGIGIAAPHIGVLQRLALIELSPESGAQAYVNPVVVWASAETSRHAEGSISMPGAVEEVERPACVRVAYQDLAGNPQEVEAAGLLAVCLQHEIDQLDGIFWLRRLSPLKRERLVKRYDKQRHRR